MTPEGHVYRVGRLSAIERAQKILKYRQKRHERNFTKRIKYQCRKTLADSRPRVRGRFARNDDAGAVLPHETKKALAAKTCKSTESLQGPLGDSRPSPGGVPDLRSLPHQSPGGWAHASLSDETLLMVLSTVQLLDCTLTVCARRQVMMQQRPSSCVESLRPNQCRHRTDRRITRIDAQTIERYVYWSLRAVKVL